MSTIIAPAAGLSQSQLRAFNALVTGSSVTDAAIAAGVHRCTVHTWCRSHELFRTALEDSKRIQAEIVHDHYRGLVDAAVACLRDIVTDLDCAPGIRLKAALAILNAAAAVPKQEAPEMFSLDAVAAAGLAAPVPAQPDPPQLADLTAGPEAALPEAALPEENDPAIESDIARSPASACLCGSGKKFWRCCGADPVPLPKPRAA